MTALWCCRTNSTMTCSAGIFENGWICKWEGPMMNATTNDVAIESIEICVEQVLLQT